MLFICIPTKPDHIKLQKVHRRVESALKIQICTHLPAASEHICPHVGKCLFTYEKWFAIRVSWQIFRLLTDIFGKSLRIVHLVENIKFLTETSVNLLYLQISFY